jgi:hypothetical protein
MYNIMLMTFKQTILNSYVIYTNIRFKMLNKRQLINLSFIISLRTIGFTYDEILDLIRRNIE